MHPIRHVGVSPTELDELVAGERWRHWCAIEPDLAAVGSLAEVRSLRGEAEDRIVGALLRLAAQDRGDDHLAAIALVHQFGGAVRVISRQFRQLAGEDIEGLVVGAMWEQIRSFPWQRRRHHFAACVMYDTRRTVRKLLMPGRDWRNHDPVVLLNPQSWVFEALIEHAGTSELREPGPDPSTELAGFLEWVARRGFVDKDDVGLLVELLASDRSNPAIPKWHRGACSVAAVEQVAGDRGVCTKTVCRRRDKVIAKLRDAVPAYIEAVA